MKKHHTKTKGDLGVLKASADLCEKGFLVCFPMSEHTPFDLVIYKNGEFRKVQVKCRALDSNGSFMVAFRNSYSTSKGVKTKQVDKSEIDVYCIYCIDNDSCYYLDPLQFNRSVSLRVRTPKNNQQQNIHFADDYREVP